MWKLSMLLGNIEKFMNECRGKKEDGVTFWYPFWCDTFIQNI